MFLTEESSEKEDKRMTPLSAIGVTPEDFAAFSQHLLQIFIE